MCFLQFACKGSAKSAIKETLGRLISGDLIFINIYKVWREDWECRESREGWEQSGQRLAQGTAAGRFAEGGLLHPERPSTARRKAVFHIAKDGLSQRAVPQGVTQAAAIRGRRLHRTHCGRRGNASFENSVKNPVLFCHDAEKA